MWMPHESGVMRGERAVCWGWRQSGNGLTHWQQNWGNNNSTKCRTVV